MQAATATPCPSCISDAAQAGIPGLEVEPASVSIRCS